LVKHLGLELSNKGLYGKWPANDSNPSIHGRFVLDRHPVAMTRKRASTSPLSCVRTIQSLCGSRNGAAATRV